MVETLATSVALELDLRMEAAAASELRDNTKGDDDFRVPHVDWDRTGERVLTANGSTASRCAMPRPSRPPATIPRASR